MNRWIILVAGPVLFGACSIKRYAESQRTASTELSEVETRSFTRRDSLAGHLGRVVRLDRRWVALEPQSGTIYRYDEQVYIDETMAVTRASGADSSLSTQREERADLAARHAVEATSKTRGAAWWWLVAIGLAALYVLRRFRFWPFK